MGDLSVDGLALYDATRGELRNRLAGRFPADFELESTVTAYAYWVCTVMRNHGRDWQSTVQEYVDLALRDAVLEAQAEKIEVELLRRELANCAKPLVDVGAGWGRFGPLYAACGLEAVYVEPSDLGCRLLRRNNLTHSTRCLGQSLCFPDGAFQSAVIGWVLHHDAPDIPTAAILGEIARVMAPGGRLLSIEPLSGRFDAPKWRGLVELAGFKVEKLEGFFDLSSSEKKGEQYACLVAVRGTG
ncbi:MAG: class I SAM-dependent methyltransferase [Anaerolineales bacterium]|nr:class I SAM-dependent methyltransferase [Anaerolineales bacterium]